MVRYALLLIALGAIVGCQTEPDGDDSWPTARYVSPPPLANPVQYQAQAVSPPIASPPVQKVNPPTPVSSIAWAVPSDWIPKVAARQWTWIIIHHSESSFGSAAIIDRWHRDRGFDELGYHFVIGNGTNSGDGQIEVGPRWPKQKWGAHDNALDNRYNRMGIGICLVGNFDNTHPTAAQMRSLVRLVTYLCRTYHIPPQNVLGHGETKSTDCPGKNLNMAEVRRDVTKALANSH